MNNHHLPPQPFRRSHGLAPKGLFSALLETDSVGQDKECPPPEDFRAAMQEVKNHLEDTPMRSLIKLNHDFHLQSKMEPSFESMVVAAGNTPAANLTLNDTLTLVRGLRYNLKHHPSPHDCEYVLFDARRGKSCN